MSVSECTTQDTIIEPWISIIKSINRNNKKFFSKLLINKMSQIKKLKERVKKCSVETFNLYLTSTVSLFSITQILTLDKLTMTLSWIIPSPGIIFLHIFICLNSSHTSSSWMKIAKYFLKHIYNNLHVICICIKTMIIIFTNCTEGTNREELKVIPSIPTVHNFMSNWCTPNKKWWLFLYG